MNHVKAVMLMSILRPVDSSTNGPSLIVIPSPEGRPRCNYVRLSPEGEWLYAVHLADVLRRRLQPDFAAQNVRP